MNTNQLLSLLVQLCLLTMGLFLTVNAYGFTPRIQLVFSDPLNLCKDANHNTHLQFTYSYQANNDFQYYSKIIDIKNAHQYINVPTPAEQNYSSAYTYTDFEITSADDCGNYELDYTNYGACYLKNLIPSPGKQLPFSYIITITPQSTGISPDGTPSYNFICKVERN